MEGIPIPSTLEVDDFIKCFPSFTSPDELIHKLIERWHVPPCALLAASIRGDSTLEISKTKFEEQIQMPSNSMRVCAYACVCVHVYADFQFEFGRSNC
jgi:hypothetical protein